MKIVNLDKNRGDLANQFKGIGAEIGVEEGVFSEMICKNQKVKKLYAIDAWKAYRDYRDHTRQSKLERFFRIAQIRLEPYNCDLVRKFSRDAVDDFMDESLDFVYIDANHAYKYVYEDLTVWSKKVKKGGIIAGHDFIKRKGQGQFYGVVMAVNDFVVNNQIEKLFIYRGDSPASWSFIKK